MDTQRPPSPHTREGQEQETLRQRAEETRVNRAFPPPMSDEATIPKRGRTWDDEQGWEAGWWGDCLNTFGEEAKQITYAHHMGLVNEPDEGHWPSYDLRDKHVIDIGGGPVSMLLKCRNAGALTVVDPLVMPKWCRKRYRRAGIDLVSCPAEEFRPMAVRDEAWIYNCLQHTQDPEKVIAVARAASKVVRIFEWVDVPASVGHPHELKAEDLHQWLGRDRPTGPFRCIELNGENGCFGTAFIGVFPSE